MTVPISRRQALTLSVSGMAMAQTGAAFAQVSSLRVQTGPPGGSTFIFTTAMQTIVQKHLGLQLNVTSGMASTRSTLDAARDQTDLFISYFSMAFKRNIITIPFFIHLRALFYQPVIFAMCGNKNIAPLFKNLFQHLRFIYQHITGA